MKKVLKVVALILVLALLACAAVIANGMMGNPISKHMAKKALEEHLAQNYSDMDLYTDTFDYNLKDGGYYAVIRSETSTDTVFFVDMDMKGNVTNDSYAADVQSMFNTSERVDEQYIQMVDSALALSGFAGEDNVLGGYLEFAENYPIDDGKDHSYAIPRQELVLDKEYTADEICAMGLRSGILIVSVADETVTPQRAAEIMLQIRSLLDEAGVTFYRMDFALHSISGEDGTQPDAILRAELLCEDITEEGLEDRIVLSNEAINEYFEQLEKEYEQLDEISD